MPRWPSWRWTATTRPWHGCRAPSPIPAARPAVHGPARPGVAAVAPGPARPARAAVGPGAAACAAALPPGIERAFGELHLALLAAAQGDAPALDAVAARLPALLGRGLQGAAVVQQVVLALAALAQGDEAAARQALQAACADAVRVGGSHAQRQVLPLTAAAQPLSARGAWRARRDATGGQRSDVAGISASPWTLDTDHRPGPTPGGIAARRRRSTCSASKARHATRLKRRPRRLPVGSAPFQTEE
jgi:hypothetical protein